MSRDHARPSVHVTFPLEEGNVQVFLRPTVLADGSLELLMRDATGWTQPC